MNQFCLAGRISRLPELKTSPQGWKTCTVDIDVERPFASTNGEYESDTISLIVWRGAAETLSACARLNAWITAKGRIQSRTHEQEGKKWTSYSMVAEKIEYIH